MNQTFLDKNYNQEIPEHYYNNLRDLNLIQIIQNHKNNKIWKQLIILTPLNSKEYKSPTSTQDLVESI